MNHIHHELLFHCIQEEIPEHQLLLIIFLDVENIRSICSVLHQLDQKIIYPHYDFKHLTEKYFEIGMKLNDFSIQLVKYWIRKNDLNSMDAILAALNQAPLLF